MVEKIAIVTYNRIGQGQYQNGVMKSGDKEIYIAQNGHRSKWAADPDYPNQYDRAQTRAMVARSVISQVNLKDMDKIFMYVGARGGDAAIEETRSIPAEKITYVMCDCGYGAKLGIIKDYGNKNARTMQCECGGRETLERILKGLLNGNQ